MINMKDFLNLLKKEISITNSVIEKVNIASSINRIVELLTKETLWDLTVDNLEMLKNNLTGENSLTDDEIRFLMVFVEMPSMLKNFKKTQGLDTQQELYLESINKKIMLSQKDVNLTHDIEELEKIVKEYKNLLSKLKNNEMFLITELDIVDVILEKNKVPFIDRVSLYKEINRINNEIFRKYNLSLSVNDVDDEVLSEDDLSVTNITMDELNLLFNEFGINWNINVSDDTTEEEIKNKEVKIKIFIEKLLKYGDLQKMREILTCLSVNKLDFVFELPEILTLTLLYSSRSKIDKLINKAKSHNLDVCELVRNKSHLLYPNVKTIETRVNNGKVGSKSKKTSTTGSLKYFVDCVEFLEQNNYPVEKVFERCESIFYQYPVRTLKKAHDSLKLYGIDLTKSDDYKSFSVLRSTEVLDKIDMIIECGVFHYYKDNLSPLVGKKINPYKFKLARYKGVSEHNIFRPHGNKIAVKGTFKNSNLYGRNEEETRALYGDFKYPCSNEELYETILKNSSNVNWIDSYNYVIDKLDSLYKSNQFDYIYDFNGVIISRYKVLRIYQTLISDPNITPNEDVLLYSITKFSMLNKEECHIIEECIKQIKFKGRG